MRARIIARSGEGYSDSLVNQTTVDQTDCVATNANDSLGDLSGELEVDLQDSDKTLYSSLDTMFEIKYPSKDIKVRVKTK